MASRELHDRPSAVTVSPGDGVAVHLTENAGTGYHWSATIAGDAVVVGSSELSPGLPARPGAAGERVIVLQAVRAGHARVEFRLARSWEPAASVDGWQLEVVVE